EDELEDIFASNARHFGSRDHVHSEVALLEHIHQHKIDFAMNDRYIGCSKPSCYCCALYMDWHEVELVSRPCHFKLWLGWCLPNSTAGDISASLRRFLNRFTDHIAADIRYSILHGSAVRSHMLDSTAGLSDSERQLQK
ncbi:hypothetical protein BAUCODRAFT_78761, partial [Baudoinia panamericana UAMH 10762]